MGKMSIRYRWINLIKIIASLLIYALVMWLINNKINVTYNYLAERETIIRESVNAYLESVHHVFVVAIIFNFLIWWPMACVPFRIRYWFERNTFAFAIALSLLLFLYIILTGDFGGVKIDDLGEGRVLYYSYSIGCGFLINLFGLSPQTVKEVLLPLKRYLCYIVVVLAVLVIGILMM